QRITFHPGQVEEKKEAFRIEGREIETPYYILNINEQGQIEKLYDKEYQRNVLAPKERGNVLQMFEDKPLDNDAWDIDIYYRQKMREVTDLKKWEIKEQGPLRL